MPWWMKLTDRITWNAEGGGAGGGTLLTTDPAGADTAAGGDQGGQDSVSGGEGQDTQAGGQDTTQGGQDTQAGADDIVPEDGVYKIDLGEGVEVDTALLEGIAPTFKELGITAKQAQALAVKFNELRASEVGAKSEQWAKTVGEWAEQAKADQEIGGAKWDATVKSATTVIRRFGNDGLKEYLNASGAGNHPEMIRFMAKVGAVIGEDNPAIADNPGRKAAADTATILYPDDKPKRG